MTTNDSSLDFGHKVLHYHKDILELPNGHSPQHMNISHYPEDIHFHGDISELLNDHF